MDMADPICEMGARATSSDSSDCPLISVMFEYMRNDSIPEDAHIYQVYIGSQADLSLIQHSCYTTLPVHVCPTSLYPVVQRHTREVACGRQSCVHPPLLLLQLFFSIINI